MSTTIEKSTVSALLRAAAERFADRRVYQTADESVLWSEHVKKADSWGAALRCRADGDAAARVAVLLPAGTEYLRLWHAALLGWFTIVPLNSRLTSSEMEDILKDVGARILVYGEDATSTIASLRARLDSQCEFLTCAAVDAALAADSSIPAPDAEHICAVVYTGGTTGRARGVMLSQRAMANSAQTLDDLWAIRAPGTVLCLSTPLFHVSSFNALIGAPIGGNLTVILPQFDIEQLLGAVERHGITHVALVPTMIDRLLGHPLFDPDKFRSLRYLSYGGSPISSATLVKLQKWLPHVGIIQSYGMTESCGSLTCPSAADHQGPERLSSAGRALPGVAITCRNDVGESLPAGQTGEIHVSCAALLSGYWGIDSPPLAPDATLATGDIGFLDDGGYLTIIDRKKDMIVTGGENVYSLEVERALALHPAVRQVTVFGIPSEIWGEQVHAVVSVDAALDVTPEDIIVFVKSRIASYKCPKSIDIRHDFLPTTAQGKINKQHLRDAYWKNRDRRVG